MTRIEESPVSDSNNKPSRNTPGVISAHELYRLDEFKARMGWTESSYRSARRKGLPVLEEGKRRYVDGSDAIRYLRRQRG